MTLDLFEAVVGQITLELPDELFDKLNGGVIVQPGEKLHKMSVQGHPLYIAGEYTHAPAMRYVTLYYGSFMRLYGRMSNEAVTARIREVLLHELRHHWESLAGERDLEIEDAEHIAAYIDAVREEETRQAEAPAADKPRSPISGEDAIQVSSYRGGAGWPEFTGSTEYDGSLHTYGEGNKDER